MGGKKRVLVGSGSTRARVAMRRALEARGLLCGEAGDTTGAIEVAQRFELDIALLDIDLPNGIGAPGGLRTAARLLAQRPGVTVIMLGDADPRDELCEAMRAGASGYLPRDLDPAAIAAGAMGALSGEAAISRVLVRRLIAELRRMSSAADERHRAGDELTSRERDVLDLLVQGRTTAEIGAELFIAKVTVRTHVSSILRKMGCDDRSSAVRAVRASQREIVVGSPTLTLVAPLPS